MRDRRTGKENAIVQQFRWSTVTMIVLLIACFLVLARAEAVQCKAHSKHVGVITGSGKSRQAAFEDAAEDCFEKHSRLFQSKTGKTVDMDSGIDLIDICANIKCST